MGDGPGELAHPQRGARDPRRRESELSLASGEHLAPGICDRERIQVIAICGDEATVAGSDELHEVRAEDGCLPEAAEPPPPERDTRSLAVVLEQRDAVPMRDRPQPHEVTRVPVQARRHHDLGALGDPALDGRG